MKVLSLADYGTMVVEDRPVPQPLPGEALIKVHSTGICGSDIHGFTGKNGRRFPGQVMGHEASGTVVEFSEGTDPQDFEVGDHITFNPVVVPEDELEKYRGREQHSPHKFLIGVKADRLSAFAEYMTVPVRNLVKLPQDIPLEYGALVEPLAVALHALRRVNVQDSDRLLVLGGGPIGQSVIIAAKFLGLTKIVLSEISEIRQEFCRNLGATPISPADDLLAQLDTIWGEAADVVVDAVGLSVTVKDAFAASKLGARVCLVGMGSPALEIDAFSISTEERTLVGSFAYSNQDFADAAQWVQEFPKEFELLISDRVTVEEGPQAFTDLASPDANIPGKVLVQF